MQRRSEAGFSLLELAIVLVVLGALASSLLGPLQVQVESRDRAKTQTTLDDARVALLGFAAVNGRLPCPDADGDGWPDPSFDVAQKASATCLAPEGLLPWLALAVPTLDAWGNRLRYRVNGPRFTWPDSDGLCNGNAQGEFDFCTTGEIGIRTRGDNPGTSAVESKFSYLVADGVPAVVWSGGRNGTGLRAANAGAVSALGPDEAANADGDASFVFRGYSRAEGACTDDATETVPLCSFDDLGVWLSPYVLFEQLVAARRLP